MAFLVHLRRLISMIPLLLFMTGSRPFSGVQEVQQHQEAEEDRQVQEAVRFQSKPVPKEGGPFGEFENRFQGEGMGRSFRKLPRQVDSCEVEFNAASKRSW